jgi:hypothetical protein
VISSVVPGQDEHVVGRSRGSLGREDRDARAGGELALLVGIAVDGVVEEVRADAAVVEQRVALARRAVAAIVLPARFASIRNSRSRAWSPWTCSSNAAYVSSRAKPAAFSRSAARPRAGRRGFGAVLGVAGVDPQRAAVRGQLLDVEQREAVGGEDRSTVMNEK